LDSDSSFLIVLIVRCPQMPFKSRQLHFEADGGATYSFKRMRQFRTYRQNSR
jgi:hypothetical protein